MSNVTTVTLKETGLFKCEFEDGSIKWYMTSDKKPVDVQAKIDALDIVDARVVVEATQIYNLKIAEVKSKGDEVTAAYLAPYPETVQKLWPTLIAEAEAGGGTYLTFLDETPETILTKRDQLIMVGMTIEKRRRAIMTELEAIKDNTDLLTTYEVTYDGIL